ncbi:response regulator [Vibrio chagasii]|uniref:response regulator n=1 Tax=Vibrio chagasii TaxID=170679 RepID=UPI0038CD3028
MKRVSIRRLFVVLASLAVLGVLVVVSLIYVNNINVNRHKNAVSVTENLVVGMSVKFKGYELWNHLLDNTKDAKPKVLSQLNDELKSNAHKVLSNYADLMKNDLTPFDHARLHRMNDEVLNRWHLIATAIDVYPNVPNSLFLRINRSSELIQIDASEIYNQNFKRVFNIQENQQKLYKLIVSSLVLFLLISLFVLFMFYRYIVIPFHKVQLYISKNDSFYMSKIKKVDTIFIELYSIFRSLSSVSTDFYLLYRSMTRNLDVKSKFLNVVSHDLRTPLGVIIGNLELVNKEHLIKGNDMRLYDSYLSAKALKRILDSSMLLSSIQHSEASMLVSVKFSSVVDTLSSILSSDLEHKNVTLQFYYSKDLPLELVLINHNLTQLLLNVIDNAIKACSFGDIVKVRFKICSDQLVISVFDSGVGLDTNELPILMLPFKQGKTSRGSIGLGSYITTMLIKSMKGSYGISSRRGTGTLFVMRFPFVSIKTAEKFGELYSLEAPLRKLYLKGNYIVKRKRHGQVFNILHSVELKDTGVGSEKEQPMTSSLRALLVEDFPLNRDLFLRIAKLIKLDVSTAPNGQSALKILGEDKFDVIFMDLQLPDVNGIEVTRKLRERGDDTVVVALTASIDPNIKKACIESGMNYFLTKPFAIDNLSDVLSKIEYEKNKSRDF